MKAPTVEAVAIATRLDPTNFIVVQMMFQLYLWARRSSAEKPWDTYWFHFSLPLLGGWRCTSTSIIIGMLRDVAKLKSKVPAGAVVCVVLSAGDTRRKRKDPDDATYFSFRRVSRARSRRVQSAGSNKEESRK